VVDFQAFIAELEAKVVSVWPEVKPSGTNPNTGGGGLFEVDQIERIAFERITGSPVVAMEWSKVITSDRIFNLEQYEVTVTLHYIKKITDLATGGISVVRAALTTLSAALNDSNYQPTAYDLIWTGEIDVGDAHPANAVFIAKGMPWTAGSLAVECLLTETGA
jgi:hypothetical protein